jgi:predicted CXXCH cytochrome family protein
VKFLIRFITKNAAGGVEHHDKLIDSATITIGRATDQTLHLRDKRVRLQHAKLEFRADHVHISTGVLSGVTINGRSQREARLAVGDVIEIGSNIMHVIEAEGDARFAITFELSGAASNEHFVSDWSTKTSGVGGWSKRRLSWTVAAAVLLVAAILPSLKLINPGVLQAGPIHAAHATIGGECSACHVTPFQRVPDAACMDCHTATHHVTDSSASVLGDVRCASCHLEHNEPPQLVNQHQDLCTNCHTDAKDFLDQHPEFDLTPSPTAAASNLRFDHAAHLDAAGIVTPDGRRVVECAECHVAEPGGARMLPVSMVDHCSSCHTLAFDPDDPTREVPHGDPEAVIQTLIEYYSARLLGADPEAVEQRVRRPGQEMSRADRDRVAAEARVQALAVAEDLFERRACSNCHTVTKETVAGDVRWSIAPVDVTAAFLPHANFSHAAHQTEISGCGDCHAANDSEMATDILIPDLNSCRDCHGSGIASRNGAQRTPSTCVMCHSFHFDAKGSYP